jgi:signal peptidase I
MKNLLLLITTIITITTINLFSQKNLRILKVVSASMEPTIKKNSLVLVEKTSKYYVGDIISWKNSPKSTIFTHRLIKIQKVGDVSLLFTKGDANEFEDPEKIHQKDIVGKVTFILPPLLNLGKSQPILKLMFIVLMFINGTILGKFSKGLLSR